MSHSNVVEQLSEGVHDNSDSKVAVASTLEAGSSEVRISERGFWALGLDSDLRITSIRRRDQVFDSGREGEFAIMDFNRQFQRLFA